jgi:hypothetical protein
LMLTVASTVSAQAPTKVPRVGILSAGPPSIRATPSQRGFEKRMSELGWVDGQTSTSSSGSRTARLRDCLTG